MIEIESADVMHMRDESFSELLDEMNSKAGQMRMAAAFSWAALSVGAIVGLATGGPGLVLCLTALPARAFGKWLDSYRRTTVLYYDLEDDAETAYRGLVDGFDGLVGCAAKWHVEAGGAVQSLTAWKRNAGASHLVDRKPTTLSYKLPDVIRSNVTPPALHVGKQVMFFLPDIILVQDSARVGAVKYGDLSIRWQNSRFIETDHVPRDAQVVDHTWKHPNKRGGPDRRFRDNRQIPVCLYETMHLTSHSGVNELVEFSRVGVAPAFADGCRLLAALPQGRTTALPSIPTSDASTAPTGTTARKPSRVTAVVLSVIGILVGISVLGTLFGSDGKEAASEISPTAPQFSEPPAAAVRTTEAHRENRVGPALQPPRTVTSDVVQSESGINGEAAPNTLRYTKTAVNLREGPGTGYAIITVVPMGSEVSVIESRGAWSRVRVDADAHGWMANSTIAPR